MAQGKKYGDDIRERAFALLSCSSNVREVAKKLGLPYSTVKTWEKKWLADRSGSEENESSDGSVEERDLAKLRTLKKEEFVNEAWESISSCNAMLSLRVKRALEYEKEIDKLFSEAIDESTPPDKRKQLVNIMASMKLEDTSKICVILGTLYDKQALACREATSIVGGSVEIKKFEDL